MEVAAIIWSILMILCCGGLLHTRFMIKRNRWVYDQLMKTLRGPNGLKRLEMLPEYDKILNRFWVRELADFVPKAQRAEFIRLGE